MDWRWSGKDAWSGRGHRNHWSRLIYWGRMVYWGHRYNRFNWSHMRKRWRSSMLQKLLSIMGQVHVIEVERAVGIGRWWRWSMYWFKNYFFNWSTRMNNVGWAMMVDG